MSALHPSSIMKIVVIHKYERKKGFVMKKFIAIGAALLVLLFSFMPSFSTANANEGIQVCCDIEPQAYPYN